jgi:predicted nucleic acid-binding protein
MSSTKDRIFIDSNVLISLAEDNFEKKVIAAALLSNRPVISTQVVNENISALLKKGIPLQKTLSHAEKIKEESCLKSISFSTSIKALSIYERYRFSWYDCLIIASALENNCKILYSEDMQHNQVIENPGNNGAGKLTIVNPFL